jgi:GxxExxY protein
VIGCAIEGHRQLGPGLLESIYKVCLANELSARGMPFRTEVPIPVRYKGADLETGYRADIVVDAKVLLELKSVEEVLPVHESQMLTYLRLSRLRVGLLLNFNVPVLKNGIRRFVH